MRGLLTTAALAALISSPAIAEEMNQTTLEETASKTYASSEVFTSAARTLGTDNHDDHDDDHDDDGDDDHDDDDDNHSHDHNH